MKKVLWSTFLLLFVLSAFSQNLSSKSFKDVLTSVKSSTYIAVEGYYVDNSSFMVTRSSDGIIEANTRYPVYEYKLQVNPHFKNSNNMVEIPVFTKKEIQGEKSLRILFLNKKQTTANQLVIDESAMLGASISGDMVKYIPQSGQVANTASLSELRDFLFNKGIMPQVGEEQI